MAEQTVLGVSKSVRYSKAIDIGVYAIKAVLLINGGAAIALMAFMGSISAIDIQEDTVISLTNAIRAFGVGVLLAALAGAASFFSEAKAYIKQWRYERIYFYIAVAFCSLSLAAFAYGIYEFTEGMRDQFLLAEQICIKGN